MKQNPTRKLSTVSGRWTILLVLAMALLIFLPAVNEYFASKRDLLQIWHQQGRLLSETLLRSADRISEFDSHAEEVRQQRLLEYGNYVRQIDSLYYPNTRKLRRTIRREKRLLTVFVDANFTTRIFGNAPGIREARQRLADWLKTAPLNSQVQTIPADILKLPGADGIAVQRSDNHGYILLIAPPPDGKRIQREQRYLQGWMDHLTKGSAIIYIALLRDGHLLAGSGPVPSDIEHSPQTHGGQLRKFDDKSLFEYRQSGPREIQVVLGLPALALERLEDDLVRRLIINSIVLLALGTILFIYLIKKQNFSLLEQRYSHLQTYSTSVLNNIEEGIIVLNEDRTIAVINPSAKYLLQLPERNWISQPCAALEPHLTAPLAIHLQQFDAFSEQPVYIKQETSGKELLLSGHRANLNDADRTQTVFIVLIRDNSAQRELETFRSRKNKLLAMGELASRVAHEIRNPLNGIAVLAQRIQKEFRPSADVDEFDNMAQTIRSESARINAIIESFLQYARAPQLNLKEISAAQWCEQVSPLIQAVGPVNIRCEVDQQAQVRLDDDQMKQVLLNLVKNAHQSAQDIPVELHLSADDDSCLIRVEDRGPGLTEDEMEKIFDLYYTTRPNGNGLGLSIVDKIVDMHNGQVRVESPYQKDGKTFTGCRFEIRLPLIN